MSQKKTNTNSEGEHWHPGMNWFKPKLTTCQNDGCQATYYKKAQTGRKYCDDCQVELERVRWNKSKARMIQKGQLNGGK